jgi:hypothetical protein
MVTKASVVWRIHKAVANGVSEFDPERLGAAYGLGVEFFGARSLWYDSLGNWRSEFIVGGSLTDFFVLDHVGKIDVSPRFLRHAMAGAKNEYVRLR